MKIVTPQKFLGTTDHFQSMNTKTLFCRMALLAMMIDAKRGVWTLEQPSSSIIWRHHRFQLLAKMYKVSQSENYWLLLGHGTATVNIFLNQYIFILYAYLFCLYS